MIGIAVLIVIKLDFNLKLANCLSLLVFFNVIPVLSVAKLHGGVKLQLSYGSVSTGKLCLVLPIGCYTLQIRMVEITSCDKA